MLWGLQKTPRQIEAKEEEIFDEKAKLQRLLVSKRDLKREVKMKYHIVSDENGKDYLRRLSGDTLGSIIRGLWQSD